MTHILQLFPEALDVNGDAQNALVLARRLTWAGIPADLVAPVLGDKVSARTPAAVVVGSSVDSALAPVRAALTSWEPALRDWAAAGIPILAVGTGLELLSDGIQVGAESIDGLRLLPGRAVPRAERATGDLVVDAAEGLLVGFENHARGFELPADATALGTVRVGVGNDGRSEGVRAGSVVGTHLHGPVLAKNPSLADSLLGAAFGDRYRADGARTVFADDTARAARERVLAAVGLHVSPRQNDDAASPA